MDTYKWLKHNLKSQRGSFLRSVDKNPLKYGYRMYIFIELISARLLNAHLWRSRL